MPDFLADKRQEINNRLTELKPQVDEYRRLEAAAEALAAIPDASTPSTAASPNGRRRRGRPRGSKATSPRSARSAAGATASSIKPRRAAGRRKGTGKRGAEALTLIQATPGVTIPELAAKMGIKQNYLYRVLPALETEDKVRKDGRGWHAR